MQETLYKFTNQKLQIYVGIPELAFLLQNYVSKKTDPICETPPYVEWLESIMVNFQLLA